MKPLKYLIVCLLLGITICLIVPFLSFTADLPQPSFYKEISLLHALWYPLLYRVFFNSTKKEIFISRYLISVVIKFISALAFIVLFGFADRKEMEPNILFIAFNYLIYLVLEITVLYHRVTKGK